MKKRLNKYYTIMVVPERGSYTKRYIVTVRAIEIAGTAAAISLLILLIFLGDYIRMRFHLSEYKKARVEMREMKLATRAMNERMESLEARLSRTVRLDRKLREMAGIEQKAPGAG